MRKAFLQTMFGIALALGTLPVLANPLVESLSGVWRERTAVGPDNLIIQEAQNNELRMLLPSGEGYLGVIDSFDSRTKTVNVVYTHHKSLVSFIWTYRHVYDSSGMPGLQVTFQTGGSNSMLLVRSLTGIDKQKLSAGLAKTRAASKSETFDSRPLASAKADSYSIIEDSPQPSFDCQKASTQVERLICSSDELATLDVKMVQAYTRLMKIYPGRDSLRSDQRSWLKNERSACKDTACLKRVITARTEHFQIEHLLFTQMGLK